ncbi:MAG: Bcr/CflA family drug resistance efflux transporter, partial [Acidocella sp. 20-61-6]
FIVAAMYGVLAVLLVWRKLPDTLPAERRTRVGLAAVLIRYVTISRERAFITHAAVGAFTSAALFAYLSATPQIFIGGYGWNTAEYAALFGLNAIAYIGYNQMNPALVNRFGIGPVIVFAVSVLVMSCLILVALTLHPIGPLGVMVALLMSEIGFGLINPCAMVGALSRHQAHAGSASALLGTMQYTGGAIAGLTMGVLGNNTVGPMAVAMLACALAAAAAAWARPPLIFSPVEN